jgi:hypothetical protein
VILNSKLFDLALAKERPEDPIEFVAKFLIEEKHRFDK